MSRIVIECGEQAVKKIVDVLRDNSVTTNTTVYEWSKILGPMSIPSPLLADFVDTWQLSGLASEALIISLRTAMKVKSDTTERVPAIELVWTGPFPPSSGRVRTTFAVMQEMIVNAKKQILLVGYSFTTSTSFPTTIVDQLSKAMLRGCEIRIAFHDDGYNYWNLKQAWPKSLPLPILLKWGGKPGDDLASLHAKVLLVDQQDLFVTSANLTHHGLNSNIEVGVRVRGKREVEQMAYHFASLERSGILHRI